MYNHNSRWTTRRSVKRKVAEHLNDLSKSEDDLVQSHPYFMDLSSGSAIDIQSQEPTSESDIEDVFSESDFNCDVDLPISFSEGGILEYDLSENDIASNCSDIEENENTTENSILEQLQIWAIDYEITQVALRELLFILKSKFPELPKDPRTVLGTPKEVKIETISGGEYYHKGLQKKLEEELVNCNLCSGTKVMLQINVDGMSLHNSTKTQFWPVLGKITSPFDSKVFAIGVYSGTTKPQNLNYLEKLIDEINLLQMAFKLMKKNINSVLNVFVQMLLPEHS